MTTKLIWFERFIAHELRVISGEKCSPELLTYHRNRILDELELCKKEIFHVATASGTVKSDIQNNVLSCQKVILRLMDMVYDQAPEFWKEFEEAKTQHVFYLTFQALEGLRAFLEEYFQSHYDFCEKISSIEMALLSNEIESALEEIQRRFLPYQHEPFFEALTSPLQGFLIKCSQRISVTQANFLRRYSTHINTIEVGVNRSEVYLCCVRSMFRYNLNSPRIFEFLTAEIQRDLDSLATHTTKIQLLHAEAKKISQYYSKPDLCYRDNMCGLKDQLKDWILAEMEYLRQEAEIQQAIGTTLENTTGQENLIKLRTNLSVNEMALWMRLSIEAGMIPSDNIAGTLKWAASTLQSKKATEISHESLRSKYYEPTTTSLVRVDKYLQVMKTILKQLD